MRVAVLLGMLCLFGASASPAAAQAIARAKPTASAAARPDTRSPIATTATVAAGASNPDRPGRTVTAGSMVSWLR